MSRVLSRGYETSAAARPRAQPEPPVRARDPARSERDISAREPRERGQVARRRVMSVATSPSWRSALRVVLRAVDKHVTSASGATAFREHVLELFRAGGGAGGDGGSRAPSIQREDVVAAKLVAAEEYAALVNAVHAHKEMLFDYGHSLDKEREQLRKATNTARYVGLEMPEMRPRDAWDDPSDGANANEGGDDEETASGPGLEKES